MGRSSEEIRAVLNQVLDLSSAEETEVSLLVSQEVITRYTGNRIHQNMEEHSQVLRVRVLCDGRMGSAGTNRLDSESLLETLEKAEAMAELAPPQEEPIGFCGPEELYQGEPDDELKELNPYRAAGTIREITERARANHLQAAGTLALSKQLLGIGTSRAGAAVAQSRANKLTVLAENPALGTSGWASVMAECPERLAGERAAEEAVRRASYAPENKELAPGAYPVILGPDAAADILTLLAVSCFGAGAYHAGSALTSGKMGEQLFGGNITLKDDPRDPRGCRSRMDYDGIPRQRVTLIDQGVIKGVVYDRETALPLGKKSTGHAQPRPALYLAGPQANHLFLSAGEYSGKELLARMGRGLYLTRFQYTSLVDPVDLTISGSTRDGTFWVEDGEIAHALPDLNFRTSIVDLLNHVKGLGRDPLLVPGDLGGVHTPELYCEGFRIN